MTGLTSKREKEGTKKRSSTIFPSDCPCMSNTAVATQDIGEKTILALADAEHTPLSKPDETEKQESDWKVCLWPETHWPCDMKGWVNGCHWACDWPGRSRERLGVQAGGSRLGANQGEKQNQTFLGIWGVWIWLQLLTRHITSRGYSRGNWGQSQPSCTVKTHAPGSPAERVSGHKGLCERLKEDFHFCWDKKHWRV